MLRHVQCTVRDLSWLAVLPLAIALTSCGSDSVTGPSVDAASPGSFEAAPGPLALEPVDLDLDGPSLDDIPLSDLAWDPVLDADYEPDTDGTMSASCRSRRVKVCFKGRTRKVARWTVKWYLRRGATRGKCQTPPDSAVCPCFTSSVIQGTADSCSSGAIPLFCSTDPTDSALFLSCDDGTPGLLGAYAAATSTGFMCSREYDVGTPIVQSDISEAEYQACLAVIAGSAFCN